MKDTTKAHATIPQHRSSATESAAKEQNSLITIQLFSAVCCVTPLTAAQWLFCSQLFSAVCCMLCNHHSTVLSCMWPPQRTCRTLPRRIKEQKKSRTALDHQSVALSHTWPPYWTCRTRPRRAKEQQKRRAALLTIQLFSVVRGHHEGHVGRD